MVNYLFPYLYFSGMTMRKCSSSLDDLLNEAFEVDSTVSSTSGTKTSVSFPKYLVPRTKKLLCV